MGQKKTAEHFDDEKNLRGKTGEQLKEVTRNLAKQRRRCRARRIIQTLQRTKNENEGCHVVVYCQNEGGVTADRQKVEGRIGKIVKGAISE